MSVFRIRHSWPRAGANICFSAAVALAVACIIAAAVPEPTTTLALTEDRTWITPPISCDSTIYISLNVMSHVELFQIEAYSGDGQLLPRFTIRESGPYKAITSGIAPGGMLRIAASVRPLAVEVQYRLITGCGAPPVSRAAHIVIIIAATAMTAGMLGIMCVVLECWRGPNLVAPAPQRWRIAGPPSAPAVTVEIGGPGRATIYIPAAFAAPPAINMAVPSTSSPTPP